MQREKEIPKRTRARQLEEMLHVEDTVFIAEVDRVKGTSATSKAEPASFRSSARGVARLWGSQLPAAKRA